MDTGNSTATLSGSPAGNSVSKDTRNPVTDAHTPRRSAEAGDGRFWLWMAAVCAVSAFYTWRFLDHGWIPHDEGTLAHPAERVLAGELPHRDFDDTYSGGQALLNAFAFKLLGRDLMSIRYAMFAVFLGWVPAVWYLVTRTLRPAVAALVTMLVVALTLPNYAAAMPSWFNLFFACFALAGMVRWVETGRRRWLIAAGAAIGLSIIIKIVGLYMLAGALVGLLLVDQEASTDGWSGDPDARTPGRSGNSDTRASELSGPPETRAPEFSPAPGSGRAVSLAVSGAALMLLILAVDLVASRSGLRELYHYVFPALGISVLVVTREWLRPPELPGTRIPRLMGAVLPLLAGVTFTVGAFLVPYALSGSLDALYNGIFVAPMRRLALASVRPPPLSVSQYAVAVGVFLVVARRLGRTARWAAAGGFGLVALWALLVRGPEAYFPMWFSIQGLTPVVVAAGFGLLMRPAAPDLDAQERRKRAVSLLLLAPLSLMALLQFPFAMPVYFLYFAPLMVLAGAALTTLGERGGEGRSTPELTAVGGFFLIFMLMFVNGGSILDMMMRPARDLETARLELPGADLRVSPGHKQTWERVTRLLTEHAGDAPVYAAPDSPELYFLSGRENPTRALFDFLGVDADRSGVLDLLEKEGVKVVAINGGPSFSHPLSPALRSELARRYPMSEQVAHFEIRWRD